MYVHTNMHVHANTHTHTLIPPPPPTQTHTHTPGVPTQSDEVSKVAQVEKLISQIATKYTMHNDLIADVWKVLQRCGPVMHSIQVEFLKIQLATKCTTYNDNWADFWEFLQRCGPVMHSIYGLQWDVKVEVNPINIAYSPVSLVNTHEHTHSHVYVVHVWCKYRYICDANIDTYIRALMGRHSGSQPHQHRIQPCLPGIYTPTHEFAPGCSTHVINI